MENFAFYVALMIGLAGLILSGALYFSKRRQSAAFAELEARLQAAEARLAAKHETPSDSKFERVTKKSRPIPPSTDELIQLRREASRLRTQLNQLRNDLQSANESREEARAVHFEEVQQLVRERDALQTQISSLEGIRQRTHKNEVDEVRKSNSDLEKSLRDLGHQVASLERVLQTEREVLTRLKSDKQDLEGQLRRWTSAAKDFDGKPLDPILFRRWKDRALTARVQYKMMKQLREMSDIKLSTYQDSVVKLADFVFESTGSRAPRVQSGEVKSDRYLAQALDVLLERGRRSSSAGAVAAASDQDDEEFDNAPIGNEASR